MRTIYIFPIAAALSLLTGCRPNAPTGVTGLPGQGEVTVSWNASSSSFLAPVKSYTVVAQPSGKKATTKNTHIVISDLTNGTAYTFTVHATNWRGISDDGLASDPVTPSAPPGVPTNVVAEINGVDAQISWTAPPAGDQPITGYKIVSAPSSHTVNTEDTKGAVLGLTPGTTYTFTVTAINSGGEGAASDPSSPVAANFLCEGELGMDKDLVTALKDNRSDAFYQAALAGAGGPPTSCQILGDPKSILDLTWRFPKRWAYSKEYNIALDDDSGTAKVTASPSSTLTAGENPLSDAQAHALIDKDRNGAGCAIDWSKVDEGADSASCDEDASTVTYTFKRDEDKKIVEIAYAGGV